jgi:4-hydroxythreonine-4-phosphate dehydrogenase
MKMLVLCADFLSSSKRVLQPNQSQAESGGNDRRSLWDRSGGCFKVPPSAAVQDIAEWVVVGDRLALEKSAASCGVALERMKAAILDVKALKSPNQLEFGKLSPDCGQAALEYVRLATRMCLDGEAQGLVTAPLNKEAVCQLGIAFSGHTEYIAQLCGVAEPRMLLSSPKLNVIHVTTHMALRRAIESTAKSILQTIELGNEAMKWLGYEQPRIATCGLNPHAGEHGLFGDEETNISCRPLRPQKKKAFVSMGRMPQTPFSFKRHVAPMNWWWPCTTTRVILR